MEIDALVVIGAALSALVTFVLGYIGWIIRRLHTKVEDAVSRGEVTAMLEAARLINTQDLSSVKEDTRSMAESVVVAVKNLESRLDDLMLHLMNQRNSK
jgi:hypothetical protein